MKQVYLSFSLLMAGFSSLLGQTYTHPTTGVQNTYNGACLVSTCSGTYYDNGGAGGNYAASINNIYRTFCPNTAGMCMRATFTSFSMNDTYFLCFGPSSCCDYLSILNGPAQNSTALYSNCTGGGPGTVTSTDPSGCLTFRMVSDGSVQLAGWAATLSCVACGGGPTGTTNADCVNATALCSGQSFTDASNGPGIRAEGCSGCNTSEVFTNWYTFRISTSGTLSFTIDPNQNSDDFDPVLYGPGVTCGALGTPIRCSYAAAAGNGNTGLGNGAVDNSEDVAGDQWVAPLNVTAGQTYYLLINGWSAASGANGFSLNFTGTAGLDCTILPAKIESFTGNYDRGMIDLTLQTSEENGVSRFIIEKEVADGQWKEVVGYAPNGAHSMYLFTDAHPRAGMNAYRVKMLTNNGDISYSEITRVAAPITRKFEAFPNPVSTELYVELLEDHDITSDLVVMNTMGQIVYKKTISLSGAQVHTEIVPTADLAPGLYILSYNSMKINFTRQ